MSRPGAVACPVRLAGVVNHRRSPELRLRRGVEVLFGLLLPGGCEAGQAAEPDAAAVTTLPSARPGETRMWMTVGERRFAITLADNASARAFAARLPLALDMSELNGNEKHADLPEPLPSDASRPGTIQNGDLLLYGTRTVVVFYATFSSSYPYTRLGRVEDPAGLPRALGPRGVRVVFSRD